MMKNNDFFEGVAIGSPSVIFDSDTLKMLYAAGGRDSKRRISYAYSSDGISWVKYNNNTPVFDVNGPGNWNCFFLDTPTWLKDSSGYKWYTGSDTTWPARIGFATSPDGYTWTKCAGNPVLTGGNPQPNYSWEGFGVATPTVLKRNNIFEIFYCGVSWWDFADNGIIDTIKIGYATSTNGETWMKDSLNPIFNTYDTGYKITEKRGPWAPSSLYMPNEDLYYIWYETAYGFGLATSADNTLSISNPAIQPSSVYVYPNPPTSVVTIRIGDEKGRDNNYFFIYNSSGSLVWQDIISENSIGIDIRDFTKGLYIVKIFNSRNNYTAKMTIK